MAIPCTGVILAGGQNSRMNRTNKAFLSINGQRFIDRLIEVYRLFFDDIIIVTNNPQEYYDLDVRIATDIYKKKCPLAGIHAGLFHAANPWIFVLPCDLPFIRKEMIQTLLDHINPNFSVVIPETSMGMEALFALYSRENMNAIEHCLETDRLKIRDFFKSKQIRKVPEKRLRAVDPELFSFFNVNSPLELEKAISMENHSGRRTEL